MTYFIIGLTANGNMEVYNRGVDEPTVGELEVVCRNHNYIQVLTAEDKFAGRVKRYVYSVEPRLVEVPI